MIKINIDGAIEHFNQNAKNGEKMTRFGLGKYLMPENSDSTVNSVMSRWSNGVMVPTPTPEDLCRISEICGVSVDFLLIKD